MRPRRPSPDQAPESALARLLEVESRLEAMLEGVRLDADAQVRAAEDDAKARVAQLDAELAAAEAALAAALEAKAEAQIAEERTGLEAARARYESVTDDEAEALAVWVVDAVLHAPDGEDR